ncbi:nesprin-2-like isoform X3 [Labrus mixtus]|uniref:nesprin-2-like isoform X3 n=1 Tax=Labrus mixtus TaxID=508554 RepID=UPI0029C0FF65|nr:nesprin-2-like isoform X3 [Labrus mixtus]
MASGGAEEDDGGIPLDIDNMHMLLQVEHDQIQKRTFTNWINAQLSKRCPPSHVSDLFSDLKSGSQLLDLLEVMTGQPMKRQRGRGVFQQRANIETALNFLKKKSIKMVNINIPDIIDGRPSIILGLIWTIILHCHIEELASTLCYSSCHSSLDSLTSLDSFSGSPVPASPVHAGRTSPLHKHFRISAKKALLMWVKDQCQRAGCSLSVKDFKKSWRSGEAFLAILCSLRPQLVDLSLVRFRSNQENLEEAFHLAERELHIPRLLEPQDVDVKDPDEKSIMTYVAQFLQYSNDMPSPDDHLQVPQSERALEVTAWLQQAYQDLSEARTATEHSSFAEKYQVFQKLSDSFTEQRKPVMTLLAAVKRCPELSQEQRALRTAWDRLEEELQRCKADLDSSLPPPLDSVVVWLQRAEAALTEDGGKQREHADAAKDARTQQDKLKTLIKEMSHHVNILDTFKNMDVSGNLVVPLEKFDEVKRRLTNIRVTAKYQGIKLEYKESRHTVLDLLGRVDAEVQTWKAPYRSQETVTQLLQDWHETMERQGQLLILMDALQKLQKKANAYTSKAALSEDSQIVTRQVKEAEREAELIQQAVTAVRGTMERVASEWETYNDCMTSLQTWLTQQRDMMHDQDMSKWTSCQARLNEAGNFLIEVTDSSASLALTEQLRKINMQWAERVKRTKFGVSSESSVGPLCLQTVPSLTQEASFLLNQPLEVSSVPLKAKRQKLQLMSKKMTEVDLSSLSPSTDFTPPQVLAEAERTCGELQRAASRLEGRLAELNHWSTETLDCYQQLKEKKRKGRPALKSTAKALISRGLQLENQVVTEGQDLQDLVAQVQKTSPLQHLSTSDMQDRISEAVNHCQEILGMFSSLGFQRPVGAANQTQKQPEPGAIVVARTKHVDKIGNVSVQTHIPNQFLAEFPSQLPQQRAKDVQQIVTQDEPTIVIPRVQILPQPLREPVPQIHSPLTPTRKDTESHPTIQPQSFPQTFNQAPSPSFSELVTSTVSKEKESSHTLQTNKSKSRSVSKPKTPQTEKKPPLPPAMDRSEVHSKAQSMAKSRLLKARFHLQGRIQQAINLFGGRDISDAQAKRKQKALKVLQPAVLEEFLGAVEGFGAFCTGSQLQEVTRLSDSVRKQWEDVRREIAAFVPVLRSQIRAGEQSFSVVQCETQTNNLHEATDQTDHGSVLQQRQAVTDEDASVEERAESLQELCDTLTPGESSLATDPVRESEEVQETQPSDTMLTSDNRGRQLWGNTPLRATGTSADTQRSSNPPQEQHADSPQQDLSPMGVAVSVQPCRDVFQVRAQDVPAENKDDLRQSKSSASGKNLKPALKAKEEQLTAHLLHITGRHQPTQAHIQAVVRGNTVETKQEPEWTVIPETAAPHQEELSPEQEVLERLTSVEKAADLMDSADLQVTLTTETLDWIIRKPIDISSLTLPYPDLVSDLQEMDVRLQSELKKLTEEERRGQKVKISSSLSPALHSSVHHLEQLRQRLEKVQSAALALDHFLVTVREAKAEIPTPSTHQDSSRQQNEADWKQDRQSWQQKLQRAAEQADSLLKTAGMTLSRDGSAVTCRDVVTFSSQQAEEKESMSTKKSERNDEIFLMGQKHKEGIKELNPLEVCRTKSWDDSSRKEGAQEQKCMSPSALEEESELEAKRRRLEGDNETNAQRANVQKDQTCRSEETVHKAKDERRRRSSQVKREEERRERLVQRRAALIGALKEMEAAAEQLGLKEPTLPALQQRTRALKDLESRLAGLHAELQHLEEEASEAGFSDGSQTGEVEEVWEATTKAVTERLERCRVLTELLKRFQSLRGELSGTLQRAESAINEQASYMGKENLQRLHTKVRETKTELSGLGDRIEEVRSVCRQLHTHLRQIPECTTIPFEEEAHALMDRWLDISERTDSHLENLHLGLTRWEGVLQLGAEVENWTTNKLAVFAESPSFQTEEDITALQNEILAQEENTERFQRRASEVQMLLQSAEPPLELQVVETQMRKKIKELKELASEAEDVHRQMVAAKEQVTARMAECANSLQKIQDSLLTLRGSDVPTVLAKLKDLLLELQTQDEQAESVLGDLSVISSIAKPLSLQSLSVDGMQLQDKVRNTHQLFSEVEEQTQRNIQDLDRLQREGEHLARWLQAAEERAGNEEGRSVLQEERLQQRERTKDIHELVSSLQNSNLQESPLVEEGSKLLEKYNNVQTNLLGGSSEKQSSLSRNVEASRTLSKSTQPSVADLRPTVASVLGESVDTQNPEDGRLQRDRAVKSAMAEEEARLEEGKCSRLKKSVRKEHQIGELMQDCQRKLASLQEKLSAFQPEQKESSAALITDAPALEALLQEVADVEKDLLQIVTLKDSISGSATAEARASLSQQVGSLQSHKRALDDSVRESLARLTENRKQRVKQVEEEICCVQTAMKELMESLDGNLCGSGEVLPDIRLLKQQWHILQGCETRLEDLAAKVSDLQKTGETNITHETHRPDVMLSVETAAKDLDSLRSVVLQSKQECVENTADRVRQDISRLQEWSQTAEPSSPSQAALDEGFLLQHSLREVLSDKDSLLNCLGSQVSEELQKSASEALSQSARTLQEFTKSPFGTELNRDLSIDVAEEIPKSESKTTLTSPEETPAMHPPASPSHSATDHKENSASNQYDNRIQTKDILGKAKEDTNQYPNVDVSKSKTKQESQLLTSSPPRTKREACVEHRDETDTLSSGIHPLSSEHRTAKPDNSPPFTPENVSEHLTAQTVTDARTQQKHDEDSAVIPKKVFTIMLEMDPRDMQVNENAGPDVFGRSQGVFDSKPVSSVGFLEKNSGKISPESEKSEAQSDTFKAVSDAQEKEKFSVDISETQKKVLDTEAPEFQSVDMPQRENVGACSPDIFSYSTAAEINDAKLTQDTMVGVPEEKSRPVKTITSPESDDKNVKLKKSLTLNESQAAHSQSENSMRVVSAGLDDVSSSASANSSFQETRQVKQDEVLNPSNPCGSVADRQLGVARAAETSFPSVRREEMTDFCPAEGQTMSSFLCCVEGENVTETQIPVSENTQQAAAQSTSPGVLEMTERETKEDLKLQEAELLKAPERQDEETLPTEEREPMVPASPEDREVAQTQPLITESMEPERTAPGLKADPPAGETSGGSQDSRKHKSTMQDILTDIQSLVERSNIINRTPHIDLNWYLKSSPGEPEIRLVRTVQKVLACRYQPAQLDIKEMAKQLQDAEDYRRCVQDQVAAMKSKSGARVCAPDALKSVEAQCSAALLDASATVQVKAAQLDQVKRYQREMKIIRAFLAVVAVEKEKMSLDISGSSALQASKLNGLLQTMVLKKGMMEELLRISSQLSVHLSDAESSGALLAQLGDVQEEWRLLEGSVKRALQHTSSSTSQFSLLIKDTKQLKAKLEALQTSSFESNDSKSALESVCLITDLKLFSQLYLHLQSESEALVQFSLGQKEKDEIKRELQEVGSLINVTKSKLDISTYSSSAKINRQLQDLITWAKQAENHISIGKKLALFPEEARIQIVEMKKFQTDILSRRSKMQAEVEQMKDIASGMETEESDQVFKTVEDLYVAITDSLGHVLDTMKKDLKERETMLCQLASMDAWLAEMHAKRDPCTRVDNVSKANIRELEIELKSHKFATVKIESTIKLVEGMAESCKEIAAGLGPGESRYLVNRLSGLWTELDGLLALEKATSWELEELIHERTSSDEELSTIQACLENISTDLKQQMFPLTHETISKTAQWKHMLMEHQCQVQEIQHCQEAQRSSLLCTIGELQDQCKALSSNAFEQEKYLHMRSQMEASRDITEEQIQRAKDKDINLGQRFRQCQTLLVELPLVKTQCQEAADQLEAIAQELNPTELNSERQRIRQTVETLVSWENSVTDDVKNLEAKLLLGLRFSSELPALIQFFQSTRAELEGAKPVDPEEKAIDIALRRCWVIWRNMESGMRVLEGLGRKDKTNLKHNKELYSLRDATMHECHVRMESLSQARESLKDYQWAAQGAISFLHNAEATFLSAPGGFLDCTEEQRQTQQALETLEDGFQAHIRHLFELVPKQPCLSLQKTEQLHINIFSQLLVGRALLEAHAQLRLESLERCEVRQQSHRRCHEDIRQHLSGLEAQLSECAGEQVTSYDRCVAQQKRATLLMEDLCCLAGKTEELRAGCPMQGCVVGKDGELGALWRRWVSLRRGIGFLMAHTEQRGEEWKDITTSMEQCCSFLASLQAEVPDSSTVSFIKEEPQELLAQAEMHQAGLEQEQQALASLEHRLEHALSLSSCHDPVSPGPVGKTLVKIQDNVRSLKERNLQVVAAAQAEEKERQQVQEEIEEVEQHVLAVLTSLEASSNPSKQQELRKDLSSQKTKLQSIMAGVQSRYAEIPPDINRRLQEVQLSLRREEEKLVEKSISIRKLNSQVAELGSGLEKVKMLLEQQSPTVPEAQKLLKRVWDELDRWHSRLMLLECEVQDLAEEHPDQAHLLIDQLTQPLQFYQNTAQLAEQRTAFLSKIPCCLQEFEDIVNSATCWLGEAQSWLSAPSSFTTARSIQNHANSLQLVLDDSERIRSALQDFRPVLDEVSAVCDMSTQKEKLDQNDQQVKQMQSKILEPLEQLLQAVEVVEETETELKTMEKNVQKIRAILSSMDNSNITLTEHLQNRQVILANVQSMQRTLEEMERCKGDLQLPQGAEESLLVFSRAKLLLQQLKELEQLTQQQATVLEENIREEDVSITKVFDSSEGTRSRQIGSVQEAAEVSEEEEDEENRSCHSSSSDTLTCSIPEDPEDTLDALDVQSQDIDEMEPLSEAKKLESLPGDISTDVKMSSEDTETSSVKPELDSKDSLSGRIDATLMTMEYKADVGEAFGPDTAAAEDEVTAATTLDRQGSPQHETLSTDPQTEPRQAAAAVEDRGLIPVTPSADARASERSTAEEDKDQSLDLVSLNVLKKQQKDGISQSGFVEESVQAEKSPELQISSAGREEKDTEQRRWSQLYTQISQKVTTLKKVKEEPQELLSSKAGATREKDPEKEMLSSGSAFSVLHGINESSSVLRQIVSSADGSHPGVSEELYDAVRKVLLSLSALTDFLLTPRGSEEDDDQLRLIQQECVSAEMVTVSELLSKVESDTKPMLSSEEPEALQCLTSLQDGLQTVQLISTSSRNQLLQHLGMAHQHQELPSNRPCLLDEFEQGKSEIFPGIKEAPSLELCVLGRHLREGPGEKVKLQQASRSLLQGTTRLLELGEECFTERQMNQVQNRCQLQAVLCRHKKLLQVLRSQLAFVQHLFQREPEALECQEDERVQLEVRAKALQQQALGLEAASQRGLQEWNRWEDNCGRLGRLLDDVEAFISSEEPEGDDEELVKDRSHLCQQTLVQLDESRAALGLLLDQRKLLQTEPTLAAAVSHAGSALEQRWQSAYRWTEQEIQRCRDIQDSRTRFHTDFTSVSDWLVGANKRLKNWSNLADTSELSAECVHSNLIELLDFSMEVESQSVQRASVSRDASQLLHLREADCPGLRAQLSQLDSSWSQLTSDLSKIQERLQQRLLTVWPPLRLLCDLEDWLRKQEARLNRETDAVLKAEDAAHITEHLQHYQELKVGVVNGQLLLDFLCQSGPRVVGRDVHALRFERTKFAEDLGALRLKWLHVQRELQSQIREAEQIHHTCADRERRLQHLKNWTRRQKKQLDHWKQPSGQSVARKALQASEDVKGRVKKVTAALQKLKLTRVCDGKDEEHTCDVIFSGQTERVCEDCGDLGKQIEALTPALRQTAEEWGRFESDLREASLHTTRARCFLQHQRAPLFSLKQAEGDRDVLQQLQEKAEREGEIWASLDKSCRGLVKNLHHVAAQGLSDQMERERKRWKDVLQDLKDEHVKAAETLSLWQEYTQLSDQSVLSLQRVKTQCEELLSSSPQQDTQDVVQSVEKLQEAAEDLQRGMGDVLSASKPVIGRLQPLAGNFIQSETRLLSRDILLLSQAISGRKKHLQEDLEQQELLHARLEAFEKQTQEIQDKINKSPNSTDSVKQVLFELSDLFAPLIDVKEMSVYGSLNNKETDRLHTLSRQWVESLTHMSDMNRELQAEHQRSLSFQEKCENLTSVQKKLEDELMSKTPQSYSSLQEMLSDHQKLELEMINGHQLLHSLLCQALESMETEAEEKRSELIARVTRTRKSWFNTVALAGERKSSIKEQVGRWRLFNRGSKIVWKLLRDVDPLLPPAGPTLSTLHQLQSCTEDYQCVEEALRLHSSVYTQTMEAGRQLCDAMADSECQSRLLSELQATQEAWERTSSLLERRRDLVNTNHQKWSQCQEGISGVMSDLDEMKNRLTRPERPQDSEEEKHIQETELSLQRLNSGLRDLTTMKTDLSQYVAAADSALLEQQLEQLHGQWEELCTKVSLRRQEIADRLNAWTIFNDKNKEFCDWLTQMENKVCHSGDLSIEEMVEKLKKDCMEEINLFSENKSHLKQLGEQLLLASDEAKQSQVHSSLQEVNQRWHHLFHHIEARVKKLKETLVTMQQLDKNMSNLRSWLSRIESELSRPITYSVCHHQEIQKRLAEQQELQRDIEQHTAGVASVLSLCDVLLRDEDAAGGGGTEAESDSLQETSRSLDQRWRTICALAQERRLRIGETWGLWCKFLDDYSRFEDWLKMAERTAASPNSADVLYTVAKEELKKFEGFQRQVHERLTQLELVNNQYRRLARENRTDRASQLKAMVHEGNRRWDTLHRRVASILRRLKYFTSQREDFEGTRESMLVWLTELDLQLTNVEHFSESDVHQKIQQLNSFQKEITLNTERIDGLIVFGEGLIQKSSPQDAALIEDELEELHSYCQEVFSRLVRFHQRLSQPPVINEEPELSSTSFSLESSLELIGRPWLGRSLGSFPATPTHLLAGAQERSGRETPVSVDSLPLEWDHTGDVGGSSSHEDEEEEEEEAEDQEDGRTYFSAHSVCSSSMSALESPRWRSQGDAETQSLHSETPPTLTSTPLKPAYLRLMSQCSGSIENIKRVSLILDDEEQPEELGLTGLTSSDKQSGVIERWELLKAQSRSDLHADSQESPQFTSDLDDITSWLESVIPHLERLQQSEPAVGMEEMAARAKELKEMQKTFTHYKSIMLSVNLQAQEAPELQERLAGMNRDWSQACTGLQQWDTGLRKTLMQCQEFHESLHSLLLWLAHAESQRYAVDISHPDTSVRALQQHHSTLTDLQTELRCRQTQQASLQALWYQLQPEDDAEESDEAQEKLHVTRSKLKLLLRQVGQDLGSLQQRLECVSASEVQGQSVSAEPPQEAANSKKSSSAQRERRASSPPRSFFYRVLRAAFPLHLLLLFLLLLPCLIPMSESDPTCTTTNNFARSFYPMLRYTNGPPPT